MNEEQPARDSSTESSPEGGVRAAAQELARRRWSHREESTGEPVVTKPPAAQTAPQAPKTTAPEVEEPSSESALEDGQEVEGENPEEVVEENEFEEEADSEEEHPAGPIDLDELADDAVLVVDGEEVTARDLKESRLRLDDYTRKTQAVAAQREVLVQREKLAAFHLGQQEQSLRSALETLSQTDWQELAQKNPQQFAAKKAQYEGVALKLQQTKAEQTKFLQQLKQFEDQISQQQAQVAQKELKRIVPGWNNGLYYSLVDYAADSGFAREAVLKYTDPHIFVLLQKAKAYDAAKKVTTQKSIKPSPKRSPKPSGAEAPQRLASKDLQAVQEQAQKTGTIDSAIELLRAKRKLAR